MRLLLPVVLLPIVFSALIAGAPGNHLDAGGDGLTLTNTVQYGAKNAADRILAEGCLGNETWLPLGQGLQNLPSEIVELRGQLYVSELLPELGFRIRHWNGSEWSTLLHCDSPCRLQWMEGFQGSLIIGGDFIDLPGSEGRTSMARWNGSTWSAISNELLWPGEGHFHLQPTVVHRGQLIVTGMEADKQGLEHVTAWDGSETKTLGTALRRSSSAVVSSLASDGRYLYVGGGFTMAGDPQDRLITRWDGSEWTGIADDDMRTIFDLEVYRGRLYALAAFSADSGNIHNGIFQWEGSRWQRLNSNHGSDFHLTDIALLGKDIYAIGMFRVGAFAEEIAGIGRFDGSQWHAVTAPDNNVFTLQNIRDELFIAGDFSSICEKPVRRIAKMCSRSKCSRLSGKLFVDLDGNCRQDKDEEGLAHTALRIDPGPSFLMSDNSGVYEAWLLPGDYTVTLLPREVWRQNCPPGGAHSIAISEAGTSIDGVDFGLQARSDVAELELSLGVSRARPGRAVEYVIHYHNVGTLPFNGAISFSYDPLLTFEHSEPAVNSVDAEKLVWRLPEIAIGATGRIIIVLTLPADPALTGEELCADVQSRPDKIENEQLLSAEDEICVEITNSFDPNDISVNPAGAIASKDQWLSVQIRFQNSGNDTAFKVVVVNPLSAMFDLSTLRLGAASHDYSFEFNDDGAAQWTFHDIHLPAKANDEAASQGFLKYRVRLHENFSVEDQAANFADIFFDFNKAIRTNTVYTWLEKEATDVDVDEAMSAALRLSPNPASSSLLLRSSQLRPGRIDLLNIVGQNIANFSLRDEKTIRLDISQFPAGVYFLSIPTREGTVLRRLIIQR